MDAKTVLTNNILINLGFKENTGVVNFGNFIHFELENKQSSKCIIIRTDKNNSFFSVFNRSECNKDDIQFIARITHLHELDLVSKVLRKAPIRAIEVA